MKYCPITYQAIQDDEDYSVQGLKKLSLQLKKLLPLPYSAKEQREQAIVKAEKMSIQGVQSKLSAKLNIKVGQFEIVDIKGQYIIKPQSNDYPELPENEALSMTLAEKVGLNVPVHGLIYAEDNSKSYFIKRFDRYGKNTKIIVEDFSQLSAAARDTKYNSSMEKVIKIIEKFCSYPKIEFIKFFKLTLFNFLIGNEDMHLKNFSLIRDGNIIKLSPPYDLLNTTIALTNAKEELALPLNGRKSNLRKQDFLKYFAIEKLELNQVVIDKVLEEFSHAMKTWHALINISFLSEKMREKYLTLLDKRTQILGIT